MKNSEKISDKRSELVLRTVASNKKASVKEALISLFSPFGGWFFVSA
jgi:hypothetical protein